MRDFGYAYERAVAAAHRRQKVFEAIIFVGGMIVIAIFYSAAYVALFWRSNP